MARRGQSLVEYGLTIALMFLLAQGAGSAIYQSFVTVVQNVRNSINVSDDPAPTAGPSPTVLLPPAPPTLTALPATPTVLAMCEVPDLVTLQYTAGVATWQNYGFGAGTLTKPAGASSSFIIGEQSLAKGSTVLCSTTMHVNLKQCQVPNLVGQTFSAARDGDWTTRGFLGARLLRPEDSSESFQIGAQQYASDSLIGCEETMLVEPQICTVPNLIGDTFDVNGSGSANTEWATQFNPANLTRMEDMPDSFTVAGQSATAGEQMGCETPMQVWPQLCRVPDLVDESYSDAQSLWTSSGFAQALQKPANAPSDFTISAQSLAASSSDQSTWKACATATMTVQPTLCTVPSVTGMEVKDAKKAWDDAQFTTDLILDPTGAANNSRVTTQSLSQDTVVSCSASMTAGVASNKIVVIPFGVTQGGTYRRSVPADMPRIGATAYDLDSGTSNGAGIAKVKFTIKKPNGDNLSSFPHEEGQMQYCAFGGDSIPCGQWANWSSAPTGTYTITIEARNSSSTQINSITFTITVTE